MLKRETAIKMAQYLADREQVAYYAFQIKNDGYWSYTRKRDFSPADTGDRPIPIKPVRR